MVNSKNYLNIFLIKKNGFNVLFSLYNERHTWLLKFYHIDFLRTFFFKSFTSEIIFFTFFAHIFPLRGWNVV